VIQRCAINPDPFAHLPHTQLLVGVKPWPLAWMFYEVFFERVGEQITIAVFERPFV